MTDQGQPPAQADPGTRGALPCPHRRAGGASWLRSKAWKACPSAGSPSATGLPKSSVHALFGSKEQLQLATINAARDSFIAEVVAPALGAAEPGRERLLALCEGYLSYVERRVFPGGCFFVAASAEVGAQARPRPRRSSPRPAAVARPARRRSQRRRRQAANCQTAPTPPSSPSSSGSSSPEPTSSRPPRRPPTRSAAPEPPSAPAYPVTARPEGPARTPPRLHQSADRPAAELAPPPAGPGQAARPDVAASAACSTSMTDSLRILAS